MTRRILRLLAAAAVGYAVSGAALASGNLVQNGGFENTPVTITTQFLNANVANWSNSNIGEALVTPNWYTNGYLFPNVGVAGPLPATSPAGGNFVFSDGDFMNSAITQTLTGLSPGQVYELTFWQALAEDTEPGITIPGPVTGYWRVGFGTSVQNSAFMTGDGTTNTISPWAQQTMFFTAQTATQVLSFFSVGTGDPPLVFLDGISLAAVPEPDTLALLVAGAGLLFVRARRRRR